MFVEMRAHGLILPGAMLQRQNNETKSPTVIQLFSWLPVPQYIYLYNTLRTFRLARLERHLRCEFSQCLNNY